jgi:hypothetical protein
MGKNIQITAINGILSPFYCIFLNTRHDKMKFPSRCISFSFALLSFCIFIVLIIPYHQAFAQHSDMDTSMIRLLFKDITRALNSNDVNGAIDHLKIVHQQLEMNGNSNTILVQDAIRALENGDIDTARSHVLIVNQQLVSSPVIPATSQESLIGGAYTKPEKEVSDTGPADTHSTPIGCPTNNCLPDPGGVLSLIPPNPNPNPVVQGKGSIASLASVPDHEDKDLKQHEDKDLKQHEDKDLKQHEDKDLKQHEDDGDGPKHDSHKKPADKHTEN